MAYENNGNGQQRKFYSFLSLTRSIDKNGGPYIGVTVHGPARKPDEQLTATTNGTNVFHFLVPVQNRTKYIADMASQLAGKQYNLWESDDGTVLARVSMFGKTAERFVAFLEKHPTPDVCLTGALSISEYTGNDGNLRTNVEITAWDFFLVKDLQSKQQGGYAPAPQQAQQGGYTPQGQQQGGWPQQTPQTQAPAPQQVPQQQGGWPQQAPQTQAPAPQQSPQQQGGWPQQAQTQAPAPQQAPQQQGGWPQQVPQTQAPAPQQVPQQQGGWSQQQPQAQPQMPQRNADGFYDLGDDDGELPF